MHFASSTGTAEPYLVEGLLKTVGEGRVYRGRAAGRTRCVEL